MKPNIALLLSLLTTTSAALSLSQLTPKSRLSVRDSNPQCYTCPSMEFWADPNPEYDHTNYYCGDPCGKAKKNKDHPCQFVDGNTGNVLPKSAGVKPGQGSFQFYQYKKQAPQNEYAISLWLYMDVTCETQLLVGQVGQDSDGNSNTNYIIKSNEWHEIPSDLIYDFYVWVGDNDDSVVGFKHLGKIIWSNTSDASSWQWTSYAPDHATAADQYWDLTDKPAYRGGNGNFTIPS